MDSAEIDKRYTITDDETLFRLISYPGCINENKELSPEIFSLYHKDEDYVSLDREYFSTLEEVIKHGYKIKRWPLKKDSFWGVIKLNAKNIRSVSQRISLDSYYEESYKAHAGISFTLDDKSKLRHTGQEIIPSWLLGIQLMLCNIVDEVISVPLQ